MSFFHDIGHTSAKTAPTLIFLPGFQWNMSVDSIINNFNWNPVVLKKMAKTSKNYHFWPNLCKNWVSMSHAQNRKQFCFCRKNKTRLKKIYFIKIPYICFGWVINVFLFCDAFLLKTVISNLTSCAGTSHVHMLQKFYLGI